MKRLKFCVVFFVVLGTAVAGYAQNRGAGSTSDALPIEDMVRAVLDAPSLVNQSFYYDDGFKALGSFSIHDHFAKRMCLGYLVTDGKRLAYRYIRAMPGLGSSNDAFETEFANLSKVEFKFYEASHGLLDYYPERLSVKFYFKTPITGLLAKWEKKDIKFDVWDVRFARRLMDFIRTAGVPATEEK
ncbi:MAG: hypothetical protein HY646_01535 [Acidobacteria bacterium]|nr:hypothetical protein [Acidobacteriota bacterium]